MRAGQLAAWLLARPAPQHAGAPGPRALAASASAAIDFSQLEPVCAAHPRAADGVRAYVRALEAYNAHTNVYSQSAYAKLPFHVHDSLALASLVASELAAAPDARTRGVLDLGSGSGLPSVLLALSLGPAVSVFALESKGRKASFLEAVGAELGLTNLHVVNANVVELVRARAFDVSVVTAKAFKPLPDVLRLAPRAIADTATLCVPVSEPQAAELAADGVLDAEAELRRVEDFLYFRRELRPALSMAQRTLYDAP